MARITDKNKKLKNKKNNKEGILSRLSAEFRRDLLPGIKKFEGHLKKEVTLLSVKNMAKHPAFTLAIAFIVWGASIPITKLALNEIGPASFLFLRMVIASVVLFPFALRQKGSFKVKEELYIFFSAIFGIGAHIYLIYLALPSVTSINVPVINALSPFLLVLLSYIFFREKIHKQKYFGMAFGFLGALVITVIPVLTGSSNVLGVYQSAKFSPYYGDLIIFISACFGSIGTLLVKPIKHIPGHIITFWQSAVVAIAILPMAIAEMPHNFMPTVSGFVVFAVLFVALLNSVFAYSVHNENVHKLESSEVGLLSYLSPIGALFVAMPLIGEVPDIWFVLGTILVLYGVWLAERKVTKRKVIA
ncbi:MAG: DMT family transporter [Patescibacteria group bacterium]